MRTDSELLDALDKAAAEGACPGLVNDDAGRWAVSETGMQNVPLDDEPSDIQTAFFVKADEWKNSVREALNAWLDERDAPTEEGSRT